MLIPRMGTVARQVCHNAGDDAFIGGKGAETALETWRNYSQPDPLGPVRQTVTKFLQYVRAGRTLGRYHLEFDVLRRKTEARVVTGGAFLDGFVSILRLQNAALTRAEKSPLLASVQGSSNFPIVAK